MKVSQFFAEIVGTFMFLMVIVNLIFGGNPTTNNSGIVPLFIAFGLCVSIYVTIGLGGFGHLNPVVSAVCATNGNISISDMCLLILAQAIGGFLAYLIWYFLVKNNAGTGILSPPPPRGGGPPTGGGPPMGGGPPRGGGKSA
jgi:glycerol uptake facilitator-like aquaporin